MGARQPHWCCSYKRPCSCLFCLSLAGHPTCKRASVVADAEPPALQVDADQDFANVFSKFLKAEEMFAEEEPAQLKAEEGQDGQVI